MREQWLKFVRHAAVEEHLRQGWCPAGIDGGLHGTNHGRYAIIMEWMCKCPIPSSRSAYDRTGQCPSSPVADTGFFNSLHDRSG